jgi:hypothetical protein
MESPETQFNQSPGALSTPLQDDDTLVDLNQPNNLVGIIFCFIFRYNIYQGNATLYIPLQSLTGLSTSFNRFKPEFSKSNAFPNNRSSDRSLGKARQR